MRNVVLVTFDSLRADHCGFMGYDRDTTPTLDAMAAEGLNFEHAISPGPSTPESMPVIMTGEFPVGSDDSGSSLLATRRAKIRRHMKTRETLAERFGRAGYATAAFSPNPYTSRYFGFDRGFDRFEDFMGGSREELYQRMLDGALAGLPLGSVLPVRILLNWIQREEVFKPWEDFYDAIRAWTEQAPEPYFLWILLMDTHDPYLVPDDYRTQSWRAMYHANYRLWRQGHEPPFSETTHERLVRAYDDSIAYADAFLDRLRTDLADDDPLIAVHGDHGEAFGEHGTYGHHQRLFEENVHVPFVVEGAADRNVTAPVTLQRTPELLESLAIDGELPAFDDRNVPARTLDVDRSAVRARTYKYLRDGDEVRLYDLVTDPGEESPSRDLDPVARAPVTAREEHVAERRRIRDAVSDRGDRL
ncbi:sulfatase [Haloplanus pelagicus]|uniref:sulfatase n=1 Tax=Haloplanus pelagicus TaxID=2949995 RepID=UPI00203E64F1|nr:sulfatase [Haloplanus sp. HW8-1]